MRRVHREADRHALVRCAAQRVSARARDGGDGALTKLLVADDDPASVELLTAYLETNGFEVASAMDGNRALELAFSGDFRLAIIDVHLPLYDGLEVLQMLRRRYVLHPMKVIALTADETQPTRDALDEAGIDGFMTKPVELKELLANVRALTAR